MNVLVTDGNLRSTLAITRSLGRRGVRVLVGEATRRSLAASSRYSAAPIVYPSARREPENFYRFLLAFLRGETVDVLIPITDVTTRIVSLHRAELERYTKTVVPSLESFDLVTDKWTLLKRAEELAIPIPATQFVDEPSMVPDIALRLNYPVVVKSSRSWIPARGEWVPTGIHYATSRSSLLQLYRETEYLAYPSLIQERIVGPGLGLFLLFDHGKLVTIFCHKRLRELPPSGGISVLRVSIPVSPTLRRYALQLFEPLCWHGVAMMEFKLDERTGRAALMEVNARFWGSLQLAIDAGVDFPYLLAQMAMGTETNAQNGYRTGVKTRWLIGDLMHTYARLFHRSPCLQLPPGSPSKAKTLLSFLKFFERDLHYEDAAYGDPMPFFYELSGHISKLVRRS